MALRKLPLGIEVPSLAGAATLAIMNAAGIASAVVSSGGSLASLGIAGAAVLALPGYFDSGREIIGTFMSRTFMVRSQARTAYMALSSMAVPVLSELANINSTPGTMAFTAFSAVALGTAIVTGGQKPLPGMRLGERVSEAEIREAENALQAAEAGPDPEVDASLAAAMPRLEDKIALHQATPGEITISRHPGGPGMRRIIPAGALRREEDPADEPGAA